MIIAITYIIKIRAWHAAPSYVKPELSDFYFIFLEKTLPLAAGFFGETQNDNG
jgi:hypothetical protein